MASPTIDGFFNSFEVRLEAPIRKHLKSVYSSLTLSLMSATLGAFVHLYTDLLKGGGILGALASLGLLIWLHTTPDDNGKNRQKRLGILMGFAFSSGLSMGPLLDVAMMMNPQIVPNALALASIVFACFSGAAIFAPDGKYLYLGGLLMSALSTMFWIGLANLFFRSVMIMQAQLWIGLAVFCGFVVWDTQVIIAKRRMGDTDFVGHSLDLFIDFVSIFRKILIILMQKEANKEDNKRRNNRR